jgi:hypothetical protein
MNAKRSIAISFFMIIISSTTCLAWEEMYIIDLQETPGNILEVKQVSWSPDPVLHPVYTRQSEGIFTISFHNYSSPCFVDMSHKNIYRTNGLTEEHIFSFSTPIQDLDYDSRGRMYFSAVGSDRGVIYHLNHHSGEYRKYIEFSVETIAQKTHGFWDGYFAFSHDDKLFLSVDGAQPGGSSIYEYNQGNLIKRFSHWETVRGFTFVDDQKTIYFANGDNRVFELKRFADLSVKHEEPAGRMINDVEFVIVPERGNGTISGRLSGGRQLWNQTSVHALGPNVFWRLLRNSSARVSKNGSYMLQNLPNGRYRVSTDIRGDTMVGFNPRYRMVNCARPISDISFNFSN